MSYYSENKMDARIEDVVSEMLCRHLHEVDTSGMQIEVHGGEVVLFGSVPEDEMRVLAEALVAKTPGVRQVWNILDIKHSGTIFP